MVSRKCEKYSFLDCDDHVCNEACNAKQLWNHKFRQDTVGNKNLNASRTVGERDDFLPKIEAPIFCGVFSKDHLKEWIDRINKKFVDDDDISIFTQYHHGAGSFLLLCGTSANGSFVSLAGIKCSQKGDTE